jgi:hypothetical protein
MLKLVFLASCCFAAVASSQYTVDSSQYTVDSSPEGKSPEGVSPESEVRSPEGMSPEGKSPESEVRSPEGMSPEVSFTIYHSPFTIHHFTVLLKALPYPPAND